MKYLIVLLLLLFCLPSFSQGSDDLFQLKTQWTDKVNASNPLPEYPRPQMKRKKWLSLNGQWDYAITNYPGNTPEVMDGVITVPFAIESALSGVKKSVSSSERIWYKRNFRVPLSWKKDKLLLHFEAVDWEAVVYVNGQKIGEHQGGYDPFTMDITPALIPGELQELMVAVWDPTSDGTQPRGKQITKPHAIWYTPVSGIWQSVWIEPVSDRYIASFNVTPDLDQQQFIFNVNANKKGDANYTVSINIKEGNTTIASSMGKLGSDIQVLVSSPKLWSPDNPFLYDIEINLMHGKQKVDQILSYAGMRKIDRIKDSDGNMRFTLNNETIFMYGTLDQGWWPDGLYTAPTDDALKYDVEKTKEMGFNTIRKHVKVESARWYYHCDRLGLLVWQDMPNGDKSADWKGPTGYDGREMARTAQSKQQFYKEWKAIMAAFYNTPSIVMWVPFNEGWGQFETVEVIDWTIKEDPSRLVNGPSGGNFFDAGHTVDQHQYPGPSMPSKELHAPAILKDKVLLLGEFGGLGLALEGHLWQKDKNWGYRNLNERDQLLKSYQELLDQIPALIKKGLAAAIYTQTTDVEGEVNGLMTYDRKVIKMDTSKMVESSKRLYTVSK